MSTEPRTSRSARILYRPVGLLNGMIAGAIASVAFKQVWKRAAPGDHEDAPGALKSEYSLGEVVAAAVVQGAIFAAVRALVDRGGARVFQRVTGEWPGD